MLKNTVIMLVVIATCCAVQAAEPYIGGGINYTKLKDARDGGVSIEALGGAKLGDALRGEVALSYNREDIRRTKVKIWELFANAYYDFQIDSKVTPYVLAGVGFGNASTGSLFGSSSRDGGLLGQVGGGLAVPVSEQVFLDFKYRYQFSQDYQLYGASFRLTAHQIGVGMRYMF